MSTQPDSGKGRKPAAEKDLSDLISDTIEFESDASQGIEQPDLDESDLFQPTGEDPIPAEQYAANVAIRRILQQSRGSQSSGQGRRLTKDEAKAFEKKLAEEEKAKGIRRVDPGTALEARRRGDEVPKEAPVPVPKKPARRVVPSWLGETEASSSSTPAEPAPFDFSPMKPPASKEPEPFVAPSEDASRSQRFGAQVPDVEPTPVPAKPKPTAKPRPKKPKPMDAPAAAPAQPADRSMVYRRYFAKMRGQSEPTEPVTPAAAPVEPAAPKPKPNPAPEPTQREPEPVVDRSAAYRRFMSEMREEAVVPEPEPTAPRPGAEVFEFIVDDDEPVDDDDDDLIVLD